METTHLLNKMLQRNSLSSYLPYLTYNKEKDCYTMESGVGIVYECAPLQFPNIEQKDTLQSLFESALVPGTSVQFLMYASKNVEPFLNAYVVSRQQAKGESVYTDIANSRKDYYVRGAANGIIKGSKVKIRHFRLFVSVTIPCEKTPEGYNRCINEHVDRYREALRQVLTIMGMNPTPVPPAKFNTLLSELLNPGHDFKDAIYDSTIPIRDQVIYSDSEINIEPDYLKIDKHYCQSMTVKQYPEEWSIAKCINFIGSMYENSKQIGVPFLLCMNCEYPDQIKDVAKFQKKAVGAKYQAFGKFSKWFPHLLKRKESFEVLQNALENESLFYGYYNIFFYAKNKKEMYDTNQSFQSLYRSMGVVLQDDPYISMPLFLQMMPMGYNSEIQKSLKRRATRSTGIIAEMLPIYADWRGFGRPVIQLLSRRGQPQYFDLFANTNGGYSAAVVASTGAGKSFFVNEMTLGYLAMGAKIWTIDIGRSYEKICDFVDGKFISFSMDSDICLNPFTLVSDIAEEMPMLKAIMAQMASQTPLDDLNMAFIEEAIRNVFEDKGSSMMPSDVVEYLSNGDDHRQKELGMRLYPYGKYGAYGGLFNGVSSLASDDEYIVYELEELKSKKDLQEVVLLSLIYQIQQDILKKDRQKLVLIDEAWDMLTGGNTTTFIETAYRRYRKYGGACVTITQSINDFYNIPAGMAIVENSDYFFLLKQRPESIEALKRTQRLSFSDGMYDLLRSVHTDSGNYSEMLVYTPNGITVSRCAVERFTQLLYTTKAEEFTLIKEYRDKGMNISQAINQVIKDMEAR